MLLELKDSNLDLNKKRVATKIGAIDSKKYKYIIPYTNDNMFKMLFGRQENIKFPCKLLSYLFSISYEELLEKLKFTKNETGKEKISDTAYRNDLVLDLNGVLINVELNNNEDEFIRDRNFSYLMRLREDKKNKKIYEQVIQVNLNNYSYIDDLEVRRDMVIQDGSGFIYTDKIIIIDIYLPNIKKKMYNKVNELTEMEKFLLIGIEESKKRALEYVGDDIVLSEFKEKIIECSMDDTIDEAYNKEWALKDMATRQGMEQNKKEMIKTMLNNGLFISEISRATNISKEEIEKVIDEEKIDYKEEAYNKEWALKDMATRQGIEQNRKEMIKTMLNNGAFISEISKLTNISKEEIEKVIDEEKIDYKEEAYDKEWALKDMATRQGMEQKEKEIIMNMIKTGFSDKDISKATSLTLEEIKKIREQ